MEIKVLNSLEEIQNGNYIGYYWCSGAKKPTVVTGSFEPKLDDKSLFIQEAMLWDEEKKVSIMVQYTHRQIITQYDLSSVSEIDLNQVTISYIGHRLENNPRLKFFRYWKEEGDQLCPGFKVLKMKAQIFIGVE
ncbi:MAG TPA: TIGR04423 family type III CRISPR-associated protein [Saprospiraceae bacterium]|nr:TIGR04423 family type III CRISPR-associated protein [Saprospirales bacterium]HRQ28796.1 TIGR04423 family type III CRISPR-associated protein [Saprospiraceae bacterium]